MVSSRAMRRSSRPSSPAAARSTRSSAAPESIAVAQRAAADLPDQPASEPRARAPATSFDRGFALGRPRNPEPRTPSEPTPGQRVRLRVKEWRPPGAAEGKRTDGDSPGPAPYDLAGPPASEPPPRRRGSPKPAVDVTPRPSASRRNTQDQVRAKALESPSHARNGSAGSLELRSPVSMNGQAVPSSTTREGREMLRNVVEAAVTRSRELGNEILGLALQRLFEESLHNKKLAHLLDAVLAQHPTAEETAEFQTHVKNTRKQIKAEHPGLHKALFESGLGGANDDEDDTDNSPRKRSTPIQTMARQRSSSRPKRSSTRNTPIAQTLLNNYDQRFESEQRSRGASERPTRASARTRANGRMSEQDSSQDALPPPKRLRRSGSTASSTSSLSSTHSYEIEMDLKPVEDISIASKNRQGLGPRAAALANGGKRAPFGGPAPLKRSPEEEALDNERAEKKRRLTKSFPGYEVGSSQIRNEANPSARKIFILPPSKRTREELVSPGSSVLDDLLIPPPPGALRNAASSPREATPTALGRPRKDAAKKMARVKVSPIKNKNGVVAGVSTSSRALREREDKPSQSQQRESSAEGSSSDEGDNQDFCNACGGNGELLCCDGCVRSFHFKCLDPPMDPKQPPEGEWYCHVCEAKRSPQARAATGLFSKMEARITKQNPVAYSLPFAVRDFFEGVTTGKDGEYVEVSTLKPKPSRGLGYDDNFVTDNLRLKDGKGNWIMCFRCGKGSGGKREIISCDFCGLKWHLDCLDPPLTSAPLKDPSNKNRPRYEWMCPAHSEKDLEARGRGGRVWKQRKPKNPIYVEPDLPRSTRNYGNIEVIHDFGSDDEDEVQEGVVYKVPATTIILNFIEKTRREREKREAQEAEARSRAEAIQRAREEALERRRNAFGNASFSEQTAAMALAGLARKDPEIELGADSVPILVHELIANAPPEIKELLDVRSPVNGEFKAEGCTATPISPEDEIKQLLLLEELCRRRRALLAKELQ